MVRTNVQRFKIQYEQTDIMDYTKHLNYESITYLICL